MKALSALRRPAIAVLIFAVASTFGGCTRRTLWNPFVWHSWLDPTRTIAVSDDSHIAVDIQHQVDDREQFWEIFPNATPPTRDDLQWSQQDYRISPGDVLDITIMDIYGENHEPVLRRAVSNEGYIHLPYINRVKVSGLSPIELTDALVRGYSPEYLLDPVISVSPVMQLENVFSIAGAVYRPNRYQIPRREFRLLDALAMAGDLSQNNLQYAYIIRKPDQADLSEPAQSAYQPGPNEDINNIENVEDLPALPGQQDQPDQDAPGQTDQPQTPADSGSDLLQQLQQFMPQQGGDDNSDEKGGPMQPRPDQPSDDEKPADAMDQSAAEPKPAVAQTTDESAEPAPAKTQQAASKIDPEKSVTPSPAPTSNSLLEDLQTNSPSANTVKKKADTEDELDSLRGLMGQPESQPATRPIKPVEMLSYSDSATAPVAAGVDPDDPFGWAQQDISDLARIIVIDLNRLKMGDPTQNVIVRDGDTVMVPPLDVGEFYVSGDVARAGAFSLTGRKVTVKMAIASASGFNSMAWPSNSVLVRRLDDNRELRIPLKLDKIMAGKAPEILLRPDDHIMVGSHLFSPFLYVLRNSFRFTYGIGFIFDRNFADTNLNNEYQDIEDLLP